jgi:hypothetical protein
MNMLNTYPPVAKSLYSHLSRVTTLSHNDKMLIAKGTALTNRRSNKYTENEIQNWTTPKSKWYDPRTWGQRKTRKNRK